MSPHVHMMIYVVSHSSVIDTPTLEC